MAKLLRHFGLGGKKAPPQQSRQDFFSSGFQPKAQGTDRISGILGDGVPGSPREDPKRTTTPRSLSLSFGAGGAKRTDPGPRCPPPNEPPGPSGTVDGPSEGGRGPAEPYLVQVPGSSGPSLRAEIEGEKEPGLPAQGCQDTVSGDCTNPCGFKVEEGKSQCLEAVRACGIELYTEEENPISYKLKDLALAEPSAKPKYYDPYASQATMPSDSIQSTPDAGEFSHYRNLPAESSHSGCSGHGQQSHLDETSAVDPSAGFTGEDDDEDVEPYMDLQEEPVVFPRAGTDRQGSETWKTASPSLRSACIDAGVNNYDEPWDLSNTRRDLEDWLRAGQKAEPSGQTSSRPPGCGGSDRPQEGCCGKPLDLQARADFRGVQKDLRPAQGYDFPCDRKTKNTERDLVGAKTAKDATKSGGTLTASSSVALATPGPQSRLGNTKVADTRPVCDYDEPWDQKRKQLVSKVNDQAAKGSHSLVSGQQFQQMAPHGIGVGAKTLNERIDPKAPLEMHAWFHASTNRMDAENLLRIHREGSYLVRRSESNQDDYSLSVKSIRGFMHMKIIKSADGRYILGQFSQPFLSIPQMIHHYTANKLPIKGADHMSLMYPISNEL